MGRQGNKMSQSKNDQMLGLTHIVAKSLPALSSKIESEEGKRVFAERLTNADPSADPTIAHRAADVIICVKAGSPIDGDTSVRENVKP